MPSEIVAQGLIWSDLVNLCTALGWLLLLFLTFERRASGSRAA